MACMNLGGTNAVQFVGTGFLPEVARQSSSDKDAVQVGGAFRAVLLLECPAASGRLRMIQQQRFGGSTLGTPARIVKSVRRRRRSGRRHHDDHREEAMFTMSMLGVTPLIQEKLVESSGMEKNAPRSPRGR